MTQLAEALAAGAISSVELVEYYLDRITRLDNQLGAFRELYSQEALKAAKRADQARTKNTVQGGLHGIPFAVKDLFDVAGKPTTAGTSLLNHNVAVDHAGTVDRLLAAGMILLGKTNTVQFAYSGVGINSDHGTPHNPWAQEHFVPGGSSSGSAVAVSAGLVPTALGTDTGGSVRIPAALTGITGLKTTVGQVSRNGVYPLSWSLDSVGPLTNSAMDAATLFGQLQGYDQADPSTRDFVAQDLANVDAPITGMRIGIANGLLFDEVEDENITAVHEAAAVFRELGAQVEEFDFPQAAQARALNPNGLIIAAEAYAVNRQLVDDRFTELDPWVAPRVRAGKDINAADYAQQQNAWQHLRMETIHALHDIDLLLAPTTQISAKSVEAITASTEVYSKHNLAYLRNTTIGNILNLCGLSVPSGTTSAGLPIGLMIYAKPFNEARALQAATAFQKATDFHLRTPDLSWI